MVGRGLLLLLEVSIIMLEYCCGENFWGSGNLCKYWFMSWGDCLLKIGIWIGYSFYLGNFLRLLCWVYINFCFVNCFYWVFCGGNLKFLMYRCIGGWGIFFLRLKRF